MPSKHFSHQSTTEEAPLILPDEIFQNGITFNVKMIGSMDIPRPMSRVEIVAAMRRVRLEFKSKGVKKRKVVLSVGVNGVKTALRIKKKRKPHLKYRSNSQRDEIILQQHPIYRIFYVSHDSQDVKVFSYIARETSSNVFHCCVFKANKKKQALRIVRTIGQAFEVSHKLNSPGGEEEENGQRTTESPNEDSESPGRVDEGSLGLTLQPTSKKPLVSTMSSKQRPPPLENTWNNNKKEGLTDSPPSHDFKSRDHQIQLLREQLEQESLSTQAAMSQLNLLREQLSTEMSARIEAENRNKQLLHHNKELLNHLHVLVQHIQELEGRPRDYTQRSSTKGSSTGSPQLTPRSKVERWFVLSRGPLETGEPMEDVTGVEGHRTSTESGFVSQKNLLTSLWKRVKSRQIQKWRQRSVLTV